MAINLFAFLFALWGIFQPIAVPPLDGDVPICQQFGYKDHVGVDYKTPVGTPVHAIQDGVVILALEDSRVYGRNIIILHSDGYASLYAHLSKINIKNGDPIKVGEIIGLSGGDPNDNIDGDGWSSGAHLHLEIRIPDHLDNNLYNINPDQYLNSLVGLPPLSR